MEEPPYKKNLERLAALQDRLSKVQKTAESLLATVSGSGGDYTYKLVYTDVTRVGNYLASNKVMFCFLSLEVKRPMAQLAEIPRHKTRSAEYRTCMLQKCPSCQSVGGQTAGIWLFRFSEAEADLAPEQELCLHRSGCQRGHLSVQASC